MCLKGSAEIRDVLRGKVHILKEKSSPRLQEKGVTPTKAAQNVAADKGYDGLYLVKVGAIPDEYVIPKLQPKTAKVNGEVVTADEGYHGLSSVTVDVPEGVIELQEKTIDPKTYPQTVTADTGKDGLSKVTVEAIQTETRTVTPTKNTQPITPSDDDVYLTEVIVHPIPDKYIDTTDATATADKIIDGETAYVNGKKVTGTMPSAAENEATVTVESASEGSVDIKYLQMFNTYLPAGETKIGTVAEANLVPSKIKKDETIFGVTGEYEGEGGTDTSDATATADEVIKGEVFYGADGRKTGTMPSVTENTPTLTLEGDGSGSVDIKHLQMFNTYLPAGETKIGTVAVENLSPSKIKKDETILGVKGEYEGEVVEIFDGTINIESGFTTISGLYEIDEQKAYNVLRDFPSAKTYEVAFTAGNDNTFTSMTFEPATGLIKYDDKGAFALNFGFAEFNNYYDGNGAKVYFEEGTVCRRDFKELFLSIVKEDATPNLISFTIGGTTYQSPSGWTWGDWCTSEYDTYGHFCADKVYKDSDHYISGVTPYDVITDGANYQLVSPSGGNGID